MKTRILLMLLCSWIISLVLSDRILGEPLQEDIKQSVTFIFVKNQNGQIVPNGTGFFVGVKNEKDPNFINTYLVTAKHVLLQNGTGSRFPSIVIRLNEKTGKSRIIELPLVGPNAVEVFDHEDPDVDISLIPMFPDPNVFEFKFILETMITTTEDFKELRIREGDDVFFVGLFTPYFGLQRNYPIVRFGKVSLISDERIPWKDKQHKSPKLLDLYLVETQSFGGNSGSPVFFWLDPTRDSNMLNIGPRTLLLAGVMKGSFLEPREIQVVETRNIQVSLENIGIAAVVPGYRLQELLLSEKLKKSRWQEKARTPEK